MTGEEIASALGGRAAGDGYSCHCPAHDDSAASLSVTERDGRLLVHCHAGCSQEAVIDALEARGLWQAAGNGSRAGATRGPGRPARPKPVPFPLPRDEARKLYSAEALQRLASVANWGMLNTEASGPYFDAEGRIVAFDARFDQAGKKTVVTVWTPDGRELTTKTPPSLLSSLDELAARPDAPVLVVEGMKCKKAASASLPGYVVVTWNGGAARAASAPWELLRGRDVTGWPDCDEPGLRAARMITARLPGSQILQVVDKARGWDAADAAAEGMDLESFVRECPRLDDDSRPQIVANERDLQEISAESILALRKSNDPPDIFLQGSELRLFVDGRLIPVAEYRLRNRLSRAARFVQRSAKGVFTPCAPPLEVVRDIPAWQGLPFPEIERVVHGPTFAPDGKLLISVGHHPEAKVFIDVEVDVDDFPGSGAEAAKWILDEVFGDFPFATPSDRANALGALITCCCRSMIPGSIPLHGWEASIHGAGKGLGVDVTVRLAFGGNGAQLMNYSQEEEEVRKHLTAALRNAPGGIKIDNIRTSIDSSSLASALTTHLWSDRVLGKSETVELPVMAVFFATGNNPSLSGEMARRYVRIRLTPSTEAPWQRTGFKHEALLEWAEDHRGEVLGAVRKMVDGWLAAGRPRWSGRPLGSFETWCRTVGGILEASGVAGFLDNHVELFESADVDGEAWRSLVDAWAGRFGDSLVSAADLFPVAQGIDGLSFAGNTEHAQRCSFGRALAAQRDRVFDDRKIVRLPGKRNGGKYRLEGSIGNIGSIPTAPHAREENTLFAHGGGVPDTPKSPDTPHTPQPPDHRSEGVLV